MRRKVVEGGWDAHARGDDIDSNGYGWGVGAGNRQVRRESETDIAGRYRSVIVRRQQQHQQ